MAAGENLRESGEVDVIAATQGQVKQKLELREDGEAVGHQQSAVAVTPGPWGERKTHMGTMKWGFLAFQMHFYFWKSSINFTWIH